MAETALKLGLKGVPFVAEHYDKVTDPLANKTKQGFSKVKGMTFNQNGNQNGGRGGYRSDTESDYEYDRYGPPRRSQTERRRPRSRDDDYGGRRRGGRSDVVEERYAYSKGNGRAKSVGRDDRYGRDKRSRGSRRDYSDSESSLSPPRRERRKSLGERALVALGIGGAAGAADRERHRSRSRSRRRRPRSGTPSSDSDGYWVRKNQYQNGNRSVPPPVSNGAAGYNDDRTPDRYKPAGYIQNGDRGSQVARRDNRSAVGERKRKGGSSSSSSSSSDEDVCSSSEDERRTKKMKGKEFLTAGLAAVATIHAAHGVYSSMEARDKRHMEVLKGELSPEEAKKKKNQARLQDAAAIGIAALGIKGAYSEWQEVQEHRKELAELNKDRQERHEKRMKKVEKAKKRGEYGNGGGGGGYGRSRSEGGGNRR